MERTNFYTKTTVNGNEEYDHLYNSLSRFTMNYPIQYYRIEDGDVLRPDLISYTAYGTVKYWWLLCFVNNIQDPFNDIIVGDLIKIPHVLDIYEFYKKYSLR